MLLEGKVAIVTGASRKIGREIAAAFAREGAKVAVVAAHSETACAASAQIGGDAIGIGCDISNEEEVRSMVNEALAAFDHIDILVNNAAIGLKKSVVDTSAAEFQRVIDVNLKGTFLCSRCVAQSMIDRKQGGRIINIGAAMVYRARPDNVAYIASKGGIWAMTRQMAVEFAPHGITVNQVSPGPTDAPVGVAKLTGPRSAEGIPLGRAGTVQDIAGAVLFMASGQAAYITGVDLLVDGGSVVSR